MYYVVSMLITKITITQLKKLLGWVGSSLVTYTCDQPLVQNTISWVRSRSRVTEIIILLLAPGHPILLAFF